MAETQQQPAPQKDYKPIGDSVYVPIPYEVPMGGVAPDLPLDVLGDQYLASSLNFQIRYGRVRRREGYDTVIGSNGNPQSAAIELFEWIPYDNSARITIATPTKFYYWDTAGDAWVDITTTARTGTYSNPVFFSSMRTSSSGLRLISVNGVDPPAWWTGGTSTAFIYMSTAVVGACGIVWRSHFLQGDTTDTADGQVRTRVHWSALGDPTVWSGTASAGSLDLLDGNASKVLTFIPLKNTLVAYKEEGAHALLYKPAPFYFTQQLLHGGITLVARKAACAILNGDAHFVFTREGAIIYDGQAVDPIGRGKVDRFLVESINWRARDVIWTHWCPVTQEVFLGLPTDSATSINAVWIYNYQYKSWWETDLTYITSNTIYRPFNLPHIMGSAAGVAKVYHQWNGVDDTTAATTISSSIQTGLLNYGAVEHKEISKFGAIISPASGSSTTVNITRASTENPLIALTYDSGQQLTVTSAHGFPRIDYKQTDRWMSWRLTHSGASETLSVRTFIPYLTVRSDARKRR